MVYPQGCLMRSSTIKLCQNADDANRLHFRRKVFERFKATTSETEELLRSNAVRENLFSKEILNKLPLPSEPHLWTWKQYVKEADNSSAWDVLRKKIVQLQFPVQEGMSASQVYKKSIRSCGRLDKKSASLGLVNSKGVRLEVYPTVAGGIPVITIAAREDFLYFVRALWMQNEPAPVPKSVGAFIISGFNNIDRFRQYKENWKSSNPYLNTESTWHQEWNELKHKKHEYQDTFILLATGPYSGIGAEEVGLTDNQWDFCSGVIRLEHECTHYAIKRIFGRKKQNLMDELTADFFGFFAAFNEVRPDLMVRCMGLENFPESLPGSRIEYYRGDPPISKGAFHIQKQLYLAAVKNLSDYVGQEEKLRLNFGHCKNNLLPLLAGISMEELASGDIKSLLQEVLF